jgi:hypothetical protein
MRKWLFGIALMVLAVSGFSVSANPTDTLTGLAQYYPANTQQFFAIRTDGDYLQTLKDLLARYEKFAPQANLSGAFDQLSQSLTGADFAEGIGAWLGDGIAVGTSQSIEALRMQRQTFTNIQSVVVTILIKDRAQAEAFVEKSLEAGLDDYEKSEDGDFTVWQPTQEFVPTQIALGDDVLLIGLFANELPLQALSEPLSDDEAFINTVAQLPAESYNALIYQDTLSQLELSRAQILFSLEAITGETYELSDMPSWLTDALKPQVIGLTIEGDTLILDLAQQIGTTFTQEMGIDYSQLQPIDADFTQTIPVNAFAFAQTANTNQTMGSLSEQIKKLDALLAESGGLLGVLGVPSADQADSTLNRILNPQARYAIDTFLTPGTLLAAFNVTFSGLTGMSYERDVVPALDGDTIAYMRLLPPSAEVAQFLPVIPDFAVVHQASDNAKAQNVLDNLISASQAYGTNYPIDDVNGNDVLVFNLFNQVLQKQGQSPLSFIDMVITSGDGLFAYGTRAAVNEAFAPVGDNITSTTEYQNASAYFLPNAQQVLFISPRNLVEPINDYFTQQDQRAPRDWMTIREVVSTIESLTLTSTVANEFSLARATITLAPSR